MEYKAFKEEEIPYGILSQYGLTQEMIEDLPMSVGEAIMDGRRSPVLPIRVKDEDGNVITSRTRFMLCRQDDGGVDVLFYPQLQRCDIDQYSKEQQDALREGKAIVAQSPDDGNTKCFVQIDMDTNQVMYVPTPVIGRNLRSLMDSFRLTSAEIQMIQDGDPVTFMESDEMVTAGIDLNERTGIRISTGDVGRWRSQQDCQLDKYNFGIYGCWIRDDKGNLDYINEEDYTEDLWEEQQKIISRNSGMKR